MQLEAKKYLYDMQQAAALLTNFTSGKSFEDYTNDPMLKAATERQFEIIGEALTKLRRLDQTLASRITDHQRIIAFRNILIHGLCRHRRSAGLGHRREQASCFAAGSRRNSLRG